MVVVSGNMAMGTYGNFGVYDTRLKPAHEPQKVTSNVTKVNSAAELAISDRLRRQVKDLTRVSAENQDRLSYVQTANGTIGAMHDILQRINVLAVEASGDINIDDRESIHSEILSLKEELRSIQLQHNFKETPIFNDKNGGAVVSFEPFEFDIDKMGLEDAGALTAEDAVKTAEASEKGIYSLNRENDYYTSVLKQLENEVAGNQADEISTDDVKNSIGRLLADTEASIMSQANQTNDSVLSLLFM